MWNHISGSIPKEIGSLSNLKILLLSGNNLTGPLPAELGYLPNLIILQVDYNNITGPLPKSFANLRSAKHFHLNNNSISGQIPSELSTLPQLLHFMLENNNLSGHLPEEFSQLPKLRILQLDNNNFVGTIPPSYSHMSGLVKLTLGNCGLQGPVPDLSSIKHLRYVDLSSNQLTGMIPTNRLSDNITAIILSNNLLTGPIPTNFSGLHLLQKLSLDKNKLNGSIPSSLWQNVILNGSARLLLDFENNLFTNITGSLDPPANVTIRLYGNPVCGGGNALNTAQFCGPSNGDVEPSGSSSNSTDSCPPQSCPTSEGYAYLSGSPVHCFCALPLEVLIRLRSPSFADFRPYIYGYKGSMTSFLELDQYQLVIDPYIWEQGHRLSMFLKFFPQANENDTHTFNSSEVQRLVNLIATYSVPFDDISGPYELFNFTFLGPYGSVFLQIPKSGMSKGALAGIILGSIACFFIVASTVAVVLIYCKKHKQSQPGVTKNRTSFKVPIKTGSVKDFSFEELEEATSGFSITTQVGQGGYGKVYKGVLANGTVVAIKRAHQGSLQSQTEFITEIEILSRLHHRNLVSLVGYCDEQGEQMLVYEYMPNGSLQDLLSGSKNSVSLTTRLHIALGSAKGVLYLHSEADPPIIHRDIKANNILLDNNLNPKVSDFGISRLVPITDDEGASAHISTNVRGTPGYLDPEYFLTHKLTEKSDVYSLGIVFLQLLTGMQPISHGRNIVREVSAACQSGMMLSMIDQSMGTYSSECIKKFMALALKCTHDKPQPRPTMLEAVRELENLITSLRDSETAPSDSDASGSGVSSGIGIAPRHVSSDNSPHDYAEFMGSNLISGVIPTIGPR
ncbi:hypothetical protein SLEP1_g15343 [Rubroshorea leprosula]|uniref:non-specific serine/threonine protein kinase n=1 Tax=Rubroshorea leprosula TaxID=152421 RepID=A0AAV5IM18_9ROSI|nr:hypothetical protein SLEP1_g15343 [Rubroshorea leprosula]